MTTTEAYIGREFNWRHAAGITRFRVWMRHRDIGYFDCIAVRGVAGTHHFVGSIQTFSAADIDDRRST